MHNTKVELQGKCRRFFYAKVDFGSEVAGKVLGVASGGGALLELTGDDLVNATFNDHNASSRIGCVEVYYNRIDNAAPLTVDLTKIQTCHDAVDSHRVAQKAEADFVFEKGITLLGSEQPTTDSLRHSLKVQELHTRDNPDRASDHDAIVQAQTDLEELCKTCEDCCEQLMVTRDEAVTFEEQES